MSLLSLPVEVLSSIIVLLDIPSAIKCQRVCKKLHQAATSEYVFRNLCRKAGYLKPQQTLEDLARPLIPDGDPKATFRSDGYTYSAWELGGRHPNELTSYKDLFITSCKLDWEKDHGDVAFAGGTNYSRDVMPGSIRIDHIDELIIVAPCYSFSASIRVIDMRTGHAITTVPFSYDRTIADFDYDQGWLVSMCCNREPRVWGLERNVLEVGQARRGHFFFHGSLARVGDEEGNVEACRLKFPSLLVMTSHQMTTFDIVTKQIVHVVDLAGEDGLLDLDPLHLDFDEDFVWVINGGYTSMELYALCRRTGNLLWHLSPESWPAALTTTYTFSSLHPRDADIGGRDEQRMKLSKKDEEPYDPDEWFLGESRCDAPGIEAVYADDKTESLCFISSSCLIVLPHYKDLAQNWTTQELSALRPLIVLRDENHPPSVDEPGWVRRESEVFETALAVADGRAAFLSRNGIVLVDLKKLLAHHSAKHSQADDLKSPRRRSPGYGDLSSSCINIWNTPHSFGPKVLLPYRIALTSTCLAWNAAGRSIKAWKVPEQLLQYGPQEVYAAPEHNAIVWIDFAKMRDHARDDRRTQEDERRDSALHKCKAETERRIAASSDGQYTLQTGEKVGNVLRSCKNPMNAVATLISLGEFFEIERWIDFDALRAKLGERAVRALRREIAKWTDQTVAAERFDPLSSGRLKVDVTQPRTQGARRPRYDEDSYAEDAWMIRYGMPPMSGMSESFQDFFGGQAMDMFGGLQDEEDMVWDNEE